MKKPLITLTSDFGVQTQGIGIMEAVALDINPDAQVIHLMHGLPDFNLFYAARTMETVNYIPIGCHVCVVDPGVGTKRKPIIIKAGRGDYLIGPDNGVLLPATRFLGGIKKAVEITNERYMRKPVSPIFHGRDIFTPAAAYLSKGVRMEEFGKELNIKNLAKAPYEEAETDGSEIKAKVISINKFGSLHLNIMHSVWDRLKIRIGENVGIKFNKTRENQRFSVPRKFDKFSRETINAPFFTTFGEVKKGQPLIFKDDYGRIEIAINQGSFIEKYPVNVGDDIVIIR